MRKMATLILVSVLLIGIVNFRPAATQPGCVPPPANMVSWWPGDGAPDDIQGSNDGTLMNGATYTSGMVGQAFSFDGNDDYVDTGNYTPTNDISIDAWINLNGTSGVYTIWGVAAPSGVYNTLFYVYNNALRWTIQTDTSNMRFWYGNFAFSSGQWYHVAMTQSGGPTVMPSMYVNGNAITVLLGTTAGTPSYASQPSAIGRQGGTTYNLFSGRIDELEIFNRALSQTEMQSIYSAGAAGKCKPQQILLVKKQSRYSLAPLASTNIAKAKTLLTEAEDLMQQAQSKDADTGTCAKLIDEANEYLEKAMKLKASPVTANYFALKAAGKLTQAIECLKALLG